MGRNPFRRQKADGTLDDGTGGGVANWWEHDSENTFLLIGDNMWNVAIQAPFTVNSGMTTSTMNSIYNPKIHCFIGTKTGDLSKMTVYINQTTSSGSCDLHVGIYESNDNGYMGDLIGVAVYPNSIKSATGTYSQTSFQESSTSTTSTTITLTKGKLYYYCFLIKSSSNNAGDVGDGLKFRAKSSSSSVGANGKVTAYGNDGYNSYFIHTWGGLATTEAGWVWVQLSSGHREYLILEY